jgi:hypothetical protein
MSPTRSALSSLRAFRVLKSPRQTYRSVTAAVLTAGLSIGIVSASTEAAFAHAFGEVGGLHGAPSTDPVRLEIGNDLALRVGGDAGGAQLEVGYGGLIWDSTVAETHRIPNFGPGWTWGTPFLDRGDDGDRLYLPGRGLHDVEPETASGLADEAGTGDLADLVFTRENGWLPAREGIAPSRAYIATLRSLATGATEYFDEFGNVFAAIDADGGRTDRDYLNLELRSITDPAGRVTTVESAWGTLVTRPDGATAVLRPNDGDNIIGRIWTSNASGTDHFVEEFSYQYGADGVRRYEEVRYVDASGEVMGEAAIRWSPEQPGTVNRVYIDNRLVYERP